MVVDEASQADLLTSVIAMSCAKNIIVVGAIKQLPNIITREAREISLKLLQQYSNEGNKTNSNLIDLVNYIKHNNFQVVRSKIYSIFDLLYKPYTEERIKVLSKIQKISPYPSENKAILDKIGLSLLIIKTKGSKEKEAIMNRLSELGYSPKQ